MVPLKTPHLPVALPPSATLTAKMFSGSLNAWDRTAELIHSSIPHGHYLSWCRCLQAEAPLSSYKL